MEEIKYTCDYCNVEVLQKVHYKLPKGWIVLGYHKESFAAIDDWRTTHHFCCQDHMDKAVKVYDNREPLTKFADIKNR